MTQPSSPYADDADPFQDAEHSSADELRNLMRFFFTGVAVITVTDDDGSLRGMTCTSLTSVTLEPPTLLACLRSSSSTLQAILTGTRFAVNVLHNRAAQTAALFGSSASRRVADDAARPSPKLGQPWLHEDSAAMAECRLLSTSVVGTHTVVFGHVTSVEIGDVASPLVYGQRRYHRLLER
ncbi:flavin reductase family protein [Mycolicibacterium madagascariense]|uniref:flavin reductase family protein n=1 Tax=Mycolicibacterium madagascariense TaxID=212765 RepID=UPI0013D50F85|nr:flavin reductase family protein [Mycolicibacterium madagascariense]MCV7012771.1 flavin reductase family protein [Mycolicibacterium madagascariense]